MPTRSDSISFGLFAERFFPVLLFVLIVILGSYNSVAIKEYFIAKQYSFANLYSAVFGWASIQTGFIFGIYGFVLGQKDGFVDKIKDTKAFSRFIGYIKKATYSGFFLTFFTMILIIGDAKFAVDSVYLYHTILFWFALFVWAFLTFLRVAYIFGILAKVSTPEFIPG